MTRILRMSKHQMFQCGWCVVAVWSLAATASLAAVSTDTLVSVDTVSELKSYNPGNETETYVWLLGYHTQGDNQPRLYHYESGSPLSDDGGTVIASTARNGCYVAQFEDVTVKDFGARGTGVNDTQAFQAAFDSGCDTLFIEQEQ